MSNLENTLFQLKFTAKTLTRQSKKAEKDEGVEKAKVKKALKQGNIDGARIYASNAIRKKNEYLNLLRLSSRIDAVSSRVETAVAMKQVSGNMLSVVKGMDKAMNTMNLERISLIMDTFESQFNDLDAQTGIMEGAISSTITTATPQDEIDLLLRQVADDANTELSQGLTEVPTAIAKAPESKVQDEDKQLTDRLRALRPAASS